jgi:hypothetical protein
MCRIFIALKLSLILFFPTLLIAASETTKPKSPSNTEYPLQNVIIVLPQKADMIKKYAAEELLCHLELIGGAATIIPETGEAGKDLESLVFHIGTPAPELKGAMEKTEAHYAIRGNHIYLWGDDFTSGKDVLEMLDLRNSRLGTLNAVYFFLENHMNFRWIRPGIDGIVCARTDKIILPKQKDFKWIMPFEMAGVRVYWWRNSIIQPLNKFAPQELRYTEKEVEQRHYDDTVWFRRTHQGTKTVINSAHAFINWWDKYGTAHPEYFGLNPYGRRGLGLELKKRVKLCVSNPAVVDQIIKDWKEKGTPKYLNVSENDGTPGFCFCPKCMALDTRTTDEDFYKHLTDRYLYFWNRVAEQAVKIRPDVKVVALVYSYYRHLPRREKVEYPDNMLFGMVPSLFENYREYFSGWEKVGLKEMFLRTNDLCESAAFFVGIDRKVYDNFQQLRHMVKIFGTDYDGSCGARNIDLEYYVAARMITMPEMPFEKILDEYCSAYGSAAPNVKEFYAYYRALGEKIMDKVSNALKQRNIELLDVPSPTLAAEYYEEKDFLNAAEILKSALSRQLTSAERSRLENLILINEHTLMTFRFFREGRLKAANAPNTLEKIARELMDFRIKYRNQIGWNWPALIGNASSGESAYWKLVDWYRSEILKVVDEPKNNPVIFRSSFDLPSSDGWTEREAFHQITCKTASFDRWSVEMHPSSDNQCIALTRLVDVTSGEKYKLSFDAKMDSGIEFVRLRIPGDKGDIANLFAYRGKDDNWQQVEGEFQIPSGIKRMRIYVIVAPGPKGSSAYMDNIILRRTAL